MWEKKLKKTIYTLNVDNYAPEITELTYPLIKAYAAKIGADFKVINTRRWPERAPVYEKLQIYDRGREDGNDWNIYIDSDALVNPDMFDITQHLNKDTVAHHGRDMATHRWVYDRVFMRDGRFIGSCNWFTVGSDWCIELWKPPEDQTYEEAIKHIFPTVGELNSLVKPDESPEFWGSHLIDDYTLSRNIAMYGFKFTTVIDICKEVNTGLSPGNPGFFWHAYTITNEQKVLEFKKVLKAWGLL